MNYRLPYIRSGEFHQTIERLFLKEIGKPLWEYDSRITLHHRNKSEVSVSIAYSKDGITMFWCFSVFMTKKAMQEHFNLFEVSKKDAPKFKELLGVYYEPYY